MKKLKGTLYYIQWVPKSSIEFRLSRKSKNNERKEVSNHKKVEPVEQN